ncbi:hypothetical protein R1sor_027235 [Riccia sorocarpa]|uniref:Uncharacterized protein n=1 Tax=Riccia sorocarpa TaxID=122646 RepID=A0ABD3GGI1_9MARC
MFVETSRVTQTTVLHEQEKEQASRLAQSLNVRVVGLEEETGEDTKALTMKLFWKTIHVHDPEVVQAYRTGFMAYLKDGHAVVTTRRRDVQ